MTAGALPYIAVIRYYVMGGILFIDTGSADVAHSITGHVVALESGTADADQQREICSICAVGVLTRPADTPASETILEMRPEFVSGWVERLIDFSEKHETGIEQTAGPTAP